MSKSSYIYNFMLKVGKIKNYNEERGFGFIEIEEPRQEVFFHITDFPRVRGGLPKIGERVTFNIQQYKNRLKAVNIIRLDIAKHKTSGAKKTKVDSKNSNFFGTVFAILVMTIFCYFVYQYVSDAIKRHELASQPVTAETIRIANQNVAHTQPIFKCDGRIHCSQMKSKAEAQWFLNNCPGTKMDGDGDGDACERQFGSGW